MSVASLSMGFQFPGTVISHEALEEARKSSSRASPPSHCLSEWDLRDGYYKRGIRPWDLAAGSVIVKEAGKLTNYRGEVLDLDGRKIVASNGRLHSAITRLTGENVRGW
jgi:fructose-1,6-bisphosphatase/inositol monophosphatase family enzyme